MIASLWMAPIFASSVHPGPLQPFVMCRACHSTTRARNSSGKKRSSGVTSRPIMATIRIAIDGDNPYKSCREIRFGRALGKSPVIASRNSVLLIAAVAGCIALPPVRAHAQWWSTRTPVDFEECADIAEKATAKETRASELAACNAKFAGRRKPGGGYSYYDFMQNRTFDIAGPNPTAEEQKHIDEQYTAFLDKQRRNFIAAAFTEKQQQQASLGNEQASLRNELGSMRNEKSVPLPVEAPNKKAAEQKARAKANCAKHSTFSCEWPVLSEKIQNFKKSLFGSSQSKPAKRS